MPKFLIEREIPGAGNLSPQELQNISQTSCGVLQQMGPQIQWLQSYVTGDKVYCVYIAPNEEMIREHAGRVAFLLIVFRKSSQLSIRQRRKRRVDRLEVNSSVPGRNLPAAGNGLWPWVFGL